jgi:hypothetical protein
MKGADQQRCREGSSRLWRFAIIAGMSVCPFEAGDRVLAPSDVGGTVGPGTVRARRQFKTRSTLEGHNETHIQVLVEFDEMAFGTRWTFCDACQPLEGD